MASNRETGRLFNLYAELLLLHGGDEKLSHHLSGAAYRLRRMEQETAGMTSAQLSKLFACPGEDIF